MWWWSQNRSAQSFGSAACSNKPSEQRTRPQSTFQSLASDGVIWRPRLSFFADNVVMLCPWSFAEAEAPYCLGLATWSVNCCASQRGAGEDSEVFNFYSFIATRSQRDHWELTLILTHLENIHYIVYSLIGQGSFGNPLVVNTVKALLMNINKNNMAF